MRDRHVGVGLCLLLAASVAACTPSSGRTETPGESSSSTADSGTAAARQAITRWNADFSNLARARNADSVAAWFASDAIVLASGAPAVRGRDSIRTFYDQFFQAMPIRDMTFATTELEVTGDVATEIGTSSLSVGGPGQATPAIVAGKYLAVWKRQPDGRWLVWRYAPSTNVLPR